MNDKNIDGLFRNKLNDFEVAPSDRVWKGVNSNLPKTVWVIRYKKQLIAAVLLLLLFPIGYILWNREKPNVSSSSQCEKTLMPAPQKHVPAMDNNKPEILMPTIKQTTIDSKRPVTNVNKPIKKSETVLINKEISQKQQFVVNQKQNPVFVETESTGFSFIPLMAYKSLTLLISEEPRLIAQPGFEELVIPYLEKRNPLHWWTGLTASADRVYYPDSRDKTSYSAGMELGLKAGKFYMGSGISYSMVAEEGRYRIDFRSYDSVGSYNKVVSFTVNPQNPNQITYKTESATVYDSLTHISIVNPLFKHQYLTIPLKVGYKFFAKNGFTAGFETGILFSERLKSEIPEVAFNHPDYQLLGIIRETPDRNDYNWQWSASIYVGYELKRGVSVALRPTFTKYLNSIYLSGNPVQPYTMGVHFGIFYNF